MIFIYAYNLYNIVIYCFKASFTSKSKPSISFASDSDSDGPKDSQETPQFCEESEEKTVQKFLGGQQYTPEVI